MKTYQNISKTYKKLMMLGVTLMLSVTVMTGCSSVEELDQTSTVESGEARVQSEEVIVESEEAIVEQVDHNVTTDPTPLSEGEDSLTLEGYGALGALEDTDLSIMDMLTYAVQDEYLAHGEYLAIIEAFGNQNPYVNIVKAEETHLAYLEEIYLAYDLEFPEDISEDHILMPDDLLEAAKTGVQAEIDNIAMYELFLSYELPEPVIEVFTALKNGSDSHLLAFQKQVDRLSN